MFYFYILQSKKDQSYYYGTTDNLERRIREHNKGKSKYTRNKIPWKRVYYEKFNTLKEARKREYQVKRKKRKGYVEWLIKTKRGVA